MLSARLFKSFVALAFLACGLLQTASALVLNTYPRHASTTQIFSSRSLKNFLDHNTIGVVIFGRHLAEANDVPPLPFVVTSGKASIAVVIPEINQDILKEYEVESVPTFWIFQNGKHILEVPGDNLNRLCNTLDLYSEYGRLIV